MPFTSPLIDDFTGANEESLARGSDWTYKNLSPGKRVDNQFGGSGSFRNSYYVGLSTGFHDLQYRTATCR